MKNNIIDFSKAKKKADKVVSLNKVRNTKSQSLTSNETFSQVYENVMKKWKENADKNCLSQYIELRLPKFARLNKPSDYLNDLNVLSEVEKRLSMNVVIFSPRTSAINSDSWLVGFHRGKEVFSTPPGMLLESHARALNILLWLEFEDALKSNL